MRLNYKPLGKYIQPVVGRNNELGDLPLVGLSIQKKFIPSIANTIGTDMSTYRIIEKKQFAYGPVTSRNGDKITIALFDDYEKALISQAYTPFEVKDPAELDPEYLMMWFRRPEFDRYARFKSHGSAREIFDWDEMCNTLLPVPHPDKQKEIVAEYNTIQDRITLNQQLIQKLEETAQAIYREWFVDFEFPYDFAQGKPDAKGKPYKSNGGEMVESELGEIPKGWEVGTLGDISNCLDFKRRPIAELERREFKGIYPYYGAMGVVDFVKEFIFDGEYVLFSEDGVNVIDEKGHPSVFFIWGKFWVNNHAHILEGKDCFSVQFIFLSLKEINVSHLVTGAAQPKINQENMNSIQLIVPDIKTLNAFQKIVSPLFELYKSTFKENQKLEELKSLLLSKLATIEN